MGKSPLVRALVSRLVRRSRELRTMLGKHPERVFVHPLGNNFERGEAIDVEVTRTVLGLVDQVGQEGTAEQRSLAEFWSDFAREPYWSWWSWPYWWHHFNGVGRFTWKVHLEPGQSTTLESTWHYFWR